MRIFVENLAFVGFHGVYDDERREGRDYRADIWANIDLEPRKDGIEHTLDYRRLAEVVVEFGTQAQFVLVETMAQEILEATLVRNPTVTSCGITIRKRASGVAGEPDYVGITMERTRHV